MFSARPFPLLVDVPPQRPPAPLTLLGPDDLEELPLLDEEEGDPDTEMTVPSGTGTFDPESLRRG